MSKSHRMLLTTKGHALPGGYACPDPVAYTFDARKQSRPEAAFRFIEALIADGLVAVVPVDGTEIEMWTLCAHKLVHIEERAVGS